MIVSVLTPTIPERAALLEECRLSVKAQTAPRAQYEHLIGVDEEKRGCSWTMNRLAAEARGTFLIPLADDDLLLPGCIRTLLEHAAAGDIVYSPPLMRYPASPHFFEGPPRIPSFALLRRDLWDELGGYDESVRREEDRGLWTRALAAGKTFARIAEPLWIYRLHGGNKSFNGGVAS